MEVRLSEALSALSHALDITEGQPRGHAERSCLIGMRIAEAAGIDAQTRSSLFYALLLKDAGCSSTAAKVASLYGNDDQEVKRDRRSADASKLVSMLKHLRRAAAPGASPLRKARHMKAVAAFGRKGLGELLEVRCERGADIACSIGLDDTTAEAIRHLDEHWDGGGHPSGLAGEEISICGRILCLAQSVEVFWQLGGAERACAMARERSGSWFDPALVAIVGDLEHDAAFWASLAAPDVSAVEPGDRVLHADDDGLDRVAEAFASVVDAKTPTTAAHSGGVADIAVALGKRLGLDAATQRLLYRAGLLHDVGKLGVSNLILDKPGRLDPSEWETVRRHPGWSFEILSRVPAFEEIARLARLHHERLDGSGYPDGVRDMDLPARILAVADVAEALSARRPYREALSPGRVIDVMRREPLDQAVVTVLSDLLTQPGGTSGGWSSAAA